MGKIVPGFVINTDNKVMGVCQMEYVIRCIWDDEACVWVASNEYIPLTMESASLDHLMKKVRDAIPELIELNHLEKPKYLYFLAESREEVYA